MITINAIKVRTKLGGILDNVANHGEHYIVERLGKPMAVIVPYEKFDFEKNRHHERQKRIEKAIKSMEKLRKQYGSRYSKEDSAVIIRRMRDQRSKHLLDVVEGRQ